ncbi:hypothetical protein [Pelagicoccus albus]|uniref:Uncharacterized protein n=1 Tax=Pelagicoccus albus TaxID=415222 RepID=A0A7X1B7P6_9BACT|nr:hypothetical protein [Pelagicoccus albus]MBC2607096.1 hypothetical protein [Pelagicoccus albus]
MKASYLFILLGLVLGLSSPSFADKIVLDSNQTLSGELLEIQAGFVTLRQWEDGGEIIRRFQPDSVTSLIFEDQDKRLDLRAFHRAKFIELLSPSDAAILTHYLRNLYKKGLYSQCLALAKSWHPKNNYNDLDQAYRKLLIHASLAESLEEEAKQHALSWLQAEELKHSDPLPWEVLARYYLEREEPEKALWISLRPIAMQSGGDSAKLGTLRDIAATCYQQLGYPDQFDEKSESRSEAKAILLPSLLKENLTFEQLLKTPIPQ